MAAAEGSKTVRAHKAFLSDPFSAANIRVFTRIHPISSWMSWKTMQSYYQHNSSRSRSSNPLNRCFQPLQMPSNNPASSQLSASTAGRAVVTAPVPSSSSSRRFRGVPGGEMQIQWPSSPASFRGMSTWDPNGIRIFSLFLGSKWLEFLWNSDLLTMFKHDQTWSWRGSWRGFI